ncbi:hypothetical protein BpHYR1_027784 [Brachionus plicatilis]|uniref:Uncharacterized protein n=1 Tax=Brachionus plicatilis TaxID=10195 RepID=A0A3M7RUG4_BRAPC|nr:hypothetical protein BpHYR1_027784 [Brachionus plicatilis]
MLSNNIQSEANLIEKFESSNRINCLFKCSIKKYCRFTKHSNQICYLYSPYGQIDFLYSQAVRVYQRFKFLDLDSLIVHWIFSESLTRDIINNIEIEPVNALFVPDRNGKPNSAVQFNNGYFKVPGGFYFYPKFSCLVWLKIINFSQKLTLFEFGNGALGDFVKFGLTRLSDSRSFLSLSVDQMNKKGVLFLPDSLLIGVWHHFGLIFDSQQKASIYLNGTLVSNKQFAFSPQAIFRKLDTLNPNQLRKNKKINYGKKLINWQHLVHNRPSVTISVMKKLTDLDNTPDN